MSKALFFRLLVCIFAVGVTMYAHIQKTNELTALRLRIPELEKEVKKLAQANEKLQYEIEQFESPIHLMELARKPEFAHLKHPLVEEVIHVKKRRGDASR